MLRCRPVYVLTLPSCFLWACATASTEPPGPPGTIEWVEWPVAVTRTQPGAVRVSGSPHCPQYAEFGISVSGTELQVTSYVDFSRGCMVREDSIVPLPALEAPPSGLPAVFTIWASLSRFSEAGSGSGGRLLGEIELREDPDTTTRFAGIAFVYRDSLNCWRVIPSRSTRPSWAFVQPPTLGLESSGHVAFIRGRLVPVSPPVCGDTVAVEASTLEIDITPQPSDRPSFLQSR